MIQSPARLVVIFTCLGHFAVHVLLALFLTLVLVVERVWERPYDELVVLWTVGASLVGLGAPLAGWLSDRWGEKPLMVLFFLGTGAGSILCGLAPTADRLWLALAVLGLFGSIYHPVALSWVVRYTHRRGAVMGIWGISGSAGVALASVIAGSLAEVWNWQFAFILPGALVMLVGLVLLATAIPPAGEAPLKDGEEAATTRRVMVQAFIALSAAMFLAALFYNAFTTMLPKWLSASLFGPGQGAASIMDVGALVTCVYLFGSAAQIAGGWLCDRYPLKWLYVATYLIKLPLPLIAGAIGGWPALLIAGAMIFFLDLGAPVENLLVARYSPPKRRGLVYGLKFVLAFVAAPLGVQTVAFFYDESGGFTGLWTVLAGVVALALLAALFVPGERPSRLRAPAVA